MTVVITYITKYVASGLFVYCPFLGGGYLLLDLQFIVTPDVCGYVFGYCFVVQYLDLFLL